jgi:hypothetical protein
MILTNGDVDQISPFRVIESASHSMFDFIRQTDVDHTEVSRADQFSKHATQAVRRVENRA